ncbi:MAG: TonB C-terminal domain-containing protein [Myxococcales bacterium]|nr:TonB C-terminal domain-containing protein [Myxococcales bacterium]
MYRQPTRMHVEPKDWTPPSALHAAWLTGAAIVGGLGFSGIFALVIGGIAIGYAFFGDVLASVATEDDAPPVVEEREIIAARFVKLGRDFQQELPNRRVPVQDTAPPDTTAISQNPRERREMPDAGPRPPNPMDDPMTRLLNRADLFAEIAEQREQEGSPDGIEEGTETTASAGDVYAGQLYVFFRRGWTVPETIARDQLRDLNVDVTITVGEDLQIQSFRTRGESANADFDQSVIAQIERLRAQGVTIPEPPLLVRPDYVGTPFTLRFRGRHASQP